jgi:hypothetical protein
VVDGILNRVWESRMEIPGKTIKNESGTEYVKRGNHV